MLDEITTSLRDLVNSVLKGVHTSIPGKIVTYDSSTNRASVLPQLRLKTDDGRIFDFPKVMNVPIVNIQSVGAKTTIAMPIKAGDDCLLIFCEDSLDRWQFESQDETYLPFNLSNGLAIVGLDKKVNAAVKEACEKEWILIQNNSMRIIVSNSFLRIFHSNGSNITVNSNGTQIIGNTTITGRLTVSGTASIGGNASVGGDLTVTGSINSGNITCGQISCTYVNCSGGGKFKNNVTAPNIPQ